jgi:hypothetical protein
MRKDDSQRQLGWCKHSRNNDVGGKEKGNRLVRRNVKSNLKKETYRNDTTSY